VNEVRLLKKDVTDWLLALIKNAKTPVLTRALRLPARYAEPVHIQRDLRPSILSFQSKDVARGLHE